MKNSPLKAGAKSLGRGSTFSAAPKPLKRDTELARKRAARPRQAVSPASPAQRLKCRLAPCVVCGVDGVHPAHLIDRSLVPDPTGDPRRVVPLCPPHHREYDDGRCLSLLEHLEPHYRTELALAVELVGLITALERITNLRWAPEISKGEAA